MSGDLALLEREAERLEAVAAAMERAYDRGTWYRFVAVFFPIPFVVVLLRLELEGWHYYVAGGLYLLFAAMLYAYDTRLAGQRDKAAAAARQARLVVSESPP